MPYDLFFLFISAESSAASAIHIAMVGYSFMSRLPVEDMQELEAWHGREIVVRKYGFPGAKVRDVLSNGCLKI